MRERRFEQSGERGAQRTALAAQGRGDLLNWLARQFNLAQQQQQQQQQQNESKGPASLAAGPQSARGAQGSTGPVPQAASAHIRHETVKRQVRTNLSFVRSVGGEQQQQPRLTHPRPPCHLAPAIDGHSLPSPALCTITSTIGDVGKRIKAPHAATQHPRPRDAHSGISHLRHTPKPLLGLPHLSFGERHLQRQLFRLPHEPQSIHICWVSPLGSASSTRLTSHRISNLRSMDLASARLA